MRMFLMSSLLLCTGVSFAAVSGTVFMDKNRNGTRDPGEPGVAGAAVSDGLEVIKTDAEGRFTLPASHPKARFVMLSVPNGTRVARHYIPLSAETAAYDFALTPWEPSAKGPHRFIQITDTELTGGVESHHKDMAQELRDLAASERAAFIIHTGDICYERGLREHITLVNSETMGVPVFWSIGNHDLVRGKTGEALFESLYGPTWYSFNAGGTHYVVLPMPGGDYRPSYSTDEVARWLANDLAAIPKGTPVVAACHDLLFQGDRFVYGGVDLVAHNLKAWLYGHWHISLVRRQGKVLTYGTSAPEKGGIDSAASAFRLIRTDAQGNPSSELRYAPVSGSLALNVSANGTLHANAYKTSAVATGLSVGDRPLERSSAWGWTLPLGKAAQNLTLTARFADGTTLSQPVPAPSQRLVWASSAKGEILFSSPVAEGGRVFVGTVDENFCGEGGVAAFDAVSGKRLWKAKTRNSVKNAIAAAEGRVFAQDAEGWVYAFKAQDGTLLWESKLPNAALPGLVSGVTLEGGTLYAGAGQSLTAFDPATGAKRWQGGGWRLREGTPDRPTLADGAIILGSHWNALYASDAKTGKYLWAQSGPDFRFRGSVAAPDPDGKSVWVPARQTLYRLEARTGKILAKKELGTSVENGGQPLITERLIVLTTVDAGVLALDRETLKEVWRLPVGEGLTYTAPYSHKPQRPIQGSAVRSGNTVFAAANDGTLYAIDLATGKELWRYVTGAPLLGTPLVCGDRLFVADLGGTLHCLNLSAQ